MPTQTLNSTTIPAGARLFGVTNDPTSEEAIEYYLVYDVYGVKLTYRVGGQSRFNELFGASAATSFLSYQQINANSTQFEDFIQVGSVDEITGAEEGLQTTIEREIRIAMGEDLPPWVRGSKEALTVFVQGTLDEWSPERINLELSKTTAFQDRYPAFQAYRDRFGSDANIGAIMDVIHTEERNLAQNLLKWRGPNTDVSTQRLQNYLSRGWTAQEINKVLKTERYVRDNPGSWQTLDAIMQAQGLVGIGSAEDIVRLALGQAPLEVYEGINDFARQQALAEAGIGISAADAAALGPGDADGEVQDVAAFRKSAQLAAQELLVSDREFAVRKFGITKRDLLAAAFGDQGLSDKPAAEIAQRIEQWQREREAASGGYEASQAFLDSRGRLNVQGLSDL